MNCYFSTGAFQTQKLTEIVDLAIAHSIDIELGSGLAHACDGLTCLRKAKGHVRFLVHNYFPAPADPFVLNLASADDIIHEQSIKLCKRAIDLCSEIGAPFYSVHAGFAFHLNPHDLGNPAVQAQLKPGLLMPREKAYEKFIVTIKDLASYALNRNVDLIVENNVVAVENLIQNGSSPLLLAEIEEIAGFLKDSRDSRIGLLLDTGHAKVSAQTRGVRPEKYFEALQPYIRALHLSENDGSRDSNEPFDRDVWFAPFLKEMASHPLVVEVYRLSTEQMLRQRETIEEILA